jgi:hypothetical protein
MDRGDLRLLVFGQIKSAQRIASAAHSAGPGGATEAALASGAGTAATHGTLGRALVIRAAFRATDELEAAATPVAGGLGILRTLRLRCRDRAHDGDDGCANCGKCAFHSSLLRRFSMTS